MGTPPDSSLLGFPKHRKWPGQAPAALSGGGTLLGFSRLGGEGSHDFKALLVVYPMIYDWLVVWLTSILFSQKYIGFRTSSQLTNSQTFFRGVAQPPTRWGRGTMGTWCLNENEHNTLSVIYKVSTCFNHPFGGAGFSQPSSSNPNLRKRIWWGAFSVMRSTPSGQGIANPNCRF